MIVLAAIFLAGQAVHFDADGVHFTNRQIRATADSTRAGLAKWAATPHGRTMIAYFDANEYEIDVAERGCEGAAGIAPEPALATLAASGNHKATKTYEVVLDPAAFHVPASMTPLPNEPATAADWMAAAWAAEMLHVWFYSQGISLPHHRRADFQEAWRAVAAELGLPSLRHGDEDEERKIARGVE